MIKLKFGAAVTEYGHVSYVSDKLLGKLYGVSASQIRRLYLRRFDDVRVKTLSFVERLKSMGPEYPRKRWGLRFLKNHEIEWLTNERTL